MRVSDTPRMPRGRDPSAFRWDVFVSYASADGRERARQLATACTEAGLRVFWDTETLQSGDDFRRVIADALEDSAAVVVLWSQAAVESRWVLGEANRAADRGVLLPVRIDECDLPVDFNAIHTQDLRDWTGESDAEQCQLLVQRVREVATAGVVEEHASVGLATGLRRLSGGAGQLAVLAPHASALDDLGDAIGAEPVEPRRTRVPRLRRVWMAVPVMLTVALSLGALSFELPTSLWLCGGLTIWIAVGGTWLAWRRRSIRAERARELSSLGWATAGGALDSVDAVVVYLPLDGVSRQALRNTTEEMGRRIGRLVRSIGPRPIYALFGEPSSTPAARSLQRATPEDQLPLLLGVTASWNREAGWLIARLAELGGSAWESMTALATRSDHAEERAALVTFAAELDSQCSLAAELTEVLQQATGGDGAIRGAYLFSRRVRGLGARAVRARVLEPDLLARARARANRRGLRALCYLLLAGSLASASWNVMAYARTTTLLGDARAAVSALREDRRLSGDELETLGEHVATLGVFEEDGAPLALEPFFPPRVSKPLEALFARAVRLTYVRPVYEEANRRLRQLGERYAGGFDLPSPAEHAEMLDDLKLVMLLSRPTMTEAEPEVGASPELEEWLAGTLAHRLGRRPESDAPIDTARRFVRLLSGCGRESTFGDAYYFARDRTTVRSAQRLLTRSSVTDLQLETIVGRCEDLGLDRTELLGGSRYFEGDVRVRGAFTRRCWDREARSLLEDDSQLSIAEPWLLGQPGEAESGQRVRMLRSAYFTAYASEWRDALRELHVPVLGSTAPEALVLLRDATRGDPPPLRLLFEVVQYHTVLVPTPPTADENEGAADAPLRGLRAALDHMDAGSEEDPSSTVWLRAQFEPFCRFGARLPPAGDPGATPRPLPLDTYYVVLRRLRDAVSRRLQARELWGGRPPASVEEDLLTAVLDARVTAEGLIEEQAGDWRPTLHRLLWPPIEGASYAVRQRR